MKKIKFVINYLIYRVKSLNEHGVHSPFVYDLLNNVIYNKADFYAYSKLESLRQELLNSGKEVSCMEMGAGSRVGKSLRRSVADLVRTAAKPPKYAKLLFRLVNHFQPAEVLELGASLGLSTAYMASASSSARVITIEGCEEVATIAKQNFQRLELKNIQLKTGNFDAVLPHVLKEELGSADFVFFDGNHRKVPTMNYFRQCLEKANEKSVFVFDDINWSDEMQEAWKEIKAHEKVTVTLDLFFIGIVFFRKEQVRQNFLIRF